MRLRYQAALLLASFAAGEAAAQELSRVPVTTFTLANGMKFLAVQRPELDGRETLGSSDANSQFGLGRELFAVFRERSGDAEQGAGIFTAVRR